MVYVSETGFVTMASDNMVMQPEAMAGPVPFAKDDGGAPLRRRTARKIGRIPDVRPIRSA